MKALITGGSGFFGEVLIKELLSKNIKCVSFDINEIDDPNLKNKIIYYKGDIRNIDDIEKCFKNIDFVFHCVAQVPLAKSKKKFEEVNINGTENILKLCHKYKVKKFIFLSSSAVYGVPFSNPIKRSTEPNPMEAYGKTKLIAENLCKDFIKKNLNVTIIRPRTIMGHGRLGIFSILFEWIIRGHNIPVFDGGNNIYQFIHAKDLANACYLATMNDKPDLFNIGTNKFSTMKNVIENLCKYANTGSKTKSLPSKYFKIFMKISSLLNLSPLGDYHSMMYGKTIYFDTSYEQKTLGWSPKFSNDEMFIESFNFFKKNMKEIKLNKNYSPHKSKSKEGILKIIKYII